MRNIRNSYSKNLIFETVVDIQDGVKGRIFSFKDMTLLYACLDVHEKYNILVKAYYH